MCYLINAALCMHIRDCGVFIAGYAEYLIEGMNGSSVGFEAEYHRMRYATLLRNYSFQKAKKGYASDNDDPPRPRTKNIFLPNETKIEALGSTQEEKDSSEVQIKSVLVENISNRASSSSSEDDEPFYKIDKNAILKSIAFSSLRNLLGDPSYFDLFSQEKTSGDEHLCYPNHPVHRTPCLSINFDLQGDVQCAYCEEEREFLKEKFYPPARFWINNKANALGIPVTRQKDSVTGDYFDTVNESEGLPQSVTIHIKDLSKIFELGEYVKVVSGGKEGATGTITSVKGYVVTVLPEKSTNTFDVLVDHVEENYEVAYCREPPRSNSKEVCEITEQDIVEFGFLWFHMPENNVTLNIPSR
ncbi:hypothetical protein BC332_24299 [Capsicum chinense]|nr:hypothetical protein BC332_24299 [Capsicum chinense]